MACDCGGCDECWAAMGYQWDRDQDPEPQDIRDMEEHARFAELLNDGLGG